MDYQKLILAADPPTKIPWDRFQMYNTLMGIAAGVSLLLVISLGRRLTKRTITDFDGYALAFGVNGAILAFLGGHMTVEWPFTVVPHANIIFGEGCLAFGILLLAAAFYLWRFQSRCGDHATKDMITIMEPVTYFIAAIGAGMAAIGVAGIKYQLFGAPPEEPITGNLSDRPLIESIFISTLFFLIATGALLSPVFAKFQSRAIGLIIAATWTTAGAAWILFSVMNYFTHIGLIVNTL